MSTIPTGPAAARTGVRDAEQLRVRDAARGMEARQATGVRDDVRPGAMDRHRAAQQGPNIATNEDRALYKAALGVDVTRAEVLPVEVALMETVRRHERSSGPITPDLVMRAQQIATTQDPHGAVADRVTSFARSALTHLEGRGFRLTPEMESLVAAGGVTRFA